MIHKKKSGTNKKMSHNDKKREQKNTNIDI